jgi:hypothetical protein
VGVAALALRDAYRALAPRWPRAAAGDVIVAALAVLMTQAMFALFAPQWVLTNDALRIGFPIGFVLLYFLRLQSPTGFHQPLAFARTITMQDLSVEIDCHQHFLRRGIRIELGAVIVVTVFFASALVFAPSFVSKVGLALALGGAVFVGVFLFRYARPRTISRTAGFAATVDLYRAELVRRLKLSKTYFWWYVLPLSIGPIILMVAPQLAKPDSVMRVGVIFAILILIAWLLIFSQKPAIEQLQRRIDQLRLVSEKA